MKARTPATLSMWASAALLSGCATLFVGTEQDVQIQSGPQASVRIINEKTNLEVFSGPTPASVVLERSERYRVVVSKTGYETKTFKLKKELRFWFLCNVVCWPLALVDFLNGSTFELEPDRVTITLEPVRRAAPLVIPPVVTPAPPMTPPVTEPPPVAPPALAPTVVPLPGPRVPTPVPPVVPPTPAPAPAVPPDSGPLSSRTDLNVVFRARDDDGQLRMIAIPLVAAHSGPVL
jgi:hypothetical protein